jgi:trehalose 6-phosphate phosphatase
VKNILARAQRDVLARFARCNTLLGFDFDGTLAPLVANRERARLRPSTRRRLERLSALYPVVVLTGRGKIDVTARLSGVPCARIVGNHGGEGGGGKPIAKGLVARWEAALRKSLVAVSGVDIEAKAFSLSVHYRAAKNPGEAKTAIFAAAKGLGVDVRVVGGKFVVNVVPVGAPHKGSALAHVIKELGATAAIYVGDDVTDEDVFEAPARELLSVRVGRTRTSAAAYYLSTQGEIDDFIDRLIELRAGARSKVLPSEPLLVAKRRATR